MNVFYDVYNLMDKILSQVQDVNETRAKSVDLKTKRWIFPTIPTGQDDSYPRITVQLSNIEEEPVSAGTFISEDYSSNIKSKTEGKIYYITIWIGLYVKRELPGKMEMPDGDIKLVKNTLLGNLLFDKLLKTIDKNTNLIKEFSFFYQPYKKEITLGYEDSSNRIVYETSLRIPVLSTTEQIFDENELIHTINQNYNIN